MKVTYLILDVEDDEDDFLLLKMAFEGMQAKYGLELMRAKNGEEALTLLESASAKPSIILLDLNMPRLDGGSVLARIRQSEGLRHLPVVVFTNSSSHEEVLRIYGLGANSFVRKPATFDDLVRFCQNFCGFWLEFSLLV